MKLVPCWNCGVTFGRTTENLGQRDCSADCYIERRTSKAGPNDCWRWGNANNHYGSASFGGEGPTTAHRFVYEHLHGPVPAGMVVMHECDVKHCVNPAHLRQGTYSQNNRDAYTRNLNPRQKGEPGHRSSITAELARQIYQADGWSYEIAERFGTTKEIVRGVRSGKTWADATKDLPKPITARWRARADRRGKGRNTDRTTVSNNDRRVTKQ